MNNERRTTTTDTSIPTLLLVSLAGVLVAVAAVIAIAETSATGALFSGIVVVLTGTAIVTMTIGRQLDDPDGREPVAVDDRSGSEHRS